MKEKIFITLAVACCIAGLTFLVKGVSTQYEKEKERSEFFAKLKQEDKEDRLKMMSPAYSNFEILTLSKDANQFKIKLVAKTSKKFSYSEDLGYRNKEVIIHSATRGGTYNLLTKDFTKDKVLKGIRESLQERLEYYGHQVDKLEIVSITKVQGQ